MGNNGKSSDRISIMSILTLCGSVASLAALCIVLIDKGSEDPQTAVWRMAIVFTCLSIIGVTGAVAYDRINCIAMNQNKSLSIKAIQILPIATVAVVIIAIFIDGIFAAIYMRWWCSGVWTFLRYAF